MAEKRFVTNLSIILVISVVLMLFLYIFVAHHRSIPDRVRQDRSALLGAGSSAAERFKPVGQDDADSAQTQQKPK